MGLRKNYKPQRGFTKPYPRPSSTLDTTIPNMAFEKRGNAKDYGKIKSKGGLPKSNQIKNKY